MDSTLPTNLTTKNGVIISISHYDLCRLTAERYFKVLRADVALWEYKAMIVPEEPDVLIYKGNETSLYEIKVSRSDFLADKKKTCRIKYQINKYQLYAKKINGMQVSVMDEASYRSVSQFFKEKPHIGKKRYFVCPKGMIDKKEVPENWGLIWFDNGKFSIKKPSENHRSNVRYEMRLLTHAFRKKTGIPDSNIIVNSFEDKQQSPQDVN